MLISPDRKCTSFDKQISIYYGYKSTGAHEKQQQNTHKVNIRQELYPEYGLRTDKNLFSFVRQKKNVFFIQILAKMPISQMEHVVNVQSQSFYFKNRITKLTIL